MLNAKQSPQRIGELPNLVGRPRRKSILNGMTSNSHNRESEGGFRSAHIRVLIYPEKLDKQAVGCNGMAIRLGEQQIWA